MNDAARTAALPVLFRALAIGALVLFVTGCQSWRPGSGGTERILAERPAKVRVIVDSGNRLELDSPMIRGDSLVGLSQGRPVGIGLERIRGVEIQQLSLMRTALFVGAGITAIAVIAAASEEEPDPPPTTTVSCPLVYSWDGSDWRLDSGTFGGAITRGLARTDVDNLDHARAIDGEVRLKVANELAETDHLDALVLLAVDHAPGTRVAPGPDGAVVGLGSTEGPTRVRDGAGRDAMERVAAPDGWSWESNPSEPTERDHLELEFVRRPGAEEARLVLDAHNTPWSAFLLTEYVRAHGNGLDAWYAAMDADPARARTFFGRIARDAFLEVSVWTPEGWRVQGYAWEAGPELVKRQVVPIDLTGVGGETVRVRLAAPTSFWLIDHVAIDYGPAPGVTVREVAPRSARTRDGGDVRDDIASADGRSWTVETGDWAEVSFAAPPVPEGLDRTYMLASTGWYRVHARREGPPDRELLARFDREPGAIARLSRERRERALAALAEAR